MQAQVTTNHYDLIGGEPAVRKLVDRFYDLMDEKDEVQALRQLHAKSLRISREKLFLFLSGWFVHYPLHIIGFSWFVSVHS